MQLKNSKFKEVLAAFLFKRQKKIAENINNEIASHNSFWRVQKEWPTAPHGGHYGYGSIHNRQNKKDCECLLVAEN